ncbi:MAG: helix-turn-helix transcriptional regulator, partial [Chloroflexi bacterium]|nr:helix-turn-helix transcriptional regulator [Chloroflexota bacterium]
MERNRRGRPRHPDVLTPAEWRVLDALREGGTNAEIAARLGLSLDTVKYHISNMLAKLELRDRRALASWRPEERRGRLGALFSVPAVVWSV